MAHHSSETSDSLRALFDRANAEPRGATGRFPLGQLTPEDEGEIAIGFTHTNGKIVVDFGKPVAWIGFTAEQADEIADTLRQHAAAVRAEGYTRG